MITLYKRKRGNKLAPCGKILDLDGEVAAAMSKGSLLGVIIPDWSERYGDGSDWFYLRPEPDILFSPCLLVAAVLQSRDKTHLTFILAQWRKPDFPVMSVYYAWKLDRCPHCHSVNCIDLSKGMEPVASCRNCLWTGSVDHLEETWDHRPAEPSES